MKQLIFAVMLFVGISMYGQYTVKAMKYYPGYKRLGKVTASGSKVNMDSLKAGAIRWVALSPDMLKIFHYGDTIIVEDDNEYINGEWVVKDRMHGRWTKAIDFMLHYTEKTGFNNPKKIVIRKK